MIKAHHNANRNYDEILEKVVGFIRNNTQENNDDFLLGIIGPTGTGKSSLMLWAYEAYDPDGCSVEYVSFDKTGFANALKKCKTKPGLRFLANDEANISKRDSLTKYNKKLIDLYFAIRGLNIFHIWCNPSADVLDKVFIEERINGIILITTKDTKRPRTYYYFRKRDLLRIYHKYKTLKVSILKKHKKRYAYYKGWFRKYDGKLWEKYVTNKNSRMTNKVDEFFEAYGSNHENLIKQPEVRKILGIGENTMTKYRKELEEKKILIEGVNMFKKGFTVHYTKEAIMHFEDLRKKNLINRESGFRKVEVVDKGSVVDNIPASTN